MNDMMKSERQVITESRDLEIHVSYRSGSVTSEMFSTESKAESADICDLLIRLLNRRAQLAHEAAGQAAMRRWKELLAKDERIGTLSRHDQFLIWVGFTKATGHHDLAEHEEYARLHGLLAEEGAASGAPYAGSIPDA